LEWGRCTKKRGDGQTTLYLHVFDWPKDEELLVPDLKPAIRRAYGKIQGIGAGNVVGFKRHCGIQEAAYTQRLRQRRDSQVLQRI